MSQETTSTTMNQTTATETNTHLVNDLETLRLQLEAERKVYCDNRKQNPEEARERLLHTLQTNDCRAIMVGVVDGDDLANAFVVAGKRGHADILEAFLHHGMNVDIKENGEWTALMYASYNNQEECIRFLLDYNAKVDLQDKDGATALMFASHNGNITVVEMLLEKNVNLNLQDENGATALVYASIEGHKEVFQVLLNHNADIDLKDNDGNTALDLADNEEIKNMIRNHVSTGYLLK